MSLRQHRRAGRRAPGGTWRSSSSRCRRARWTGHAGQQPGRSPAGSEVRWLMSSDVCKHCTHAACLDVCPTGALFRTEFGTVRGAGGHLQRLRLLHPGLPVRRDRPAARATAGRGSARCATTGSARAEAGLRQGLPDRLHPVRAAGRAARAGRRAGGASCTQRGDDRRPALRPRPGRRGRRRRRVLPAAGRARGVRAAAGPGGDHPGPAARCGGTPRRPRSAWPPPWPPAFLRRPR